MANLQTTPCPRCGLPGTLRIGNVLWALPIGEFSLAGAMPKVSARERPQLTCARCPYQLLGEYDGRHAVFRPGGAEPATTRTDDT